MSYLRLGFYLLCMTSSFFCFSQKTLLHRKTASMMKRNEWSGEINNAGKTFYTRTTGVGWVLPTRQLGDVEIRYGSSWMFSSHHRFTKNMNRFFAYGVGLGFQVMTYEVKQQTYNLLSPNVQYQKQHLYFYSLPFDGYLRQNWEESSRGYGFFTSFGVQGAYHFYQVLVNQEKLDPSQNQGVGRRIAYNSRLDYLNKLAYYGTFRIGRGHFSIGCLYRLNEVFRASDSINNGNAINDLPKWMGVLEINIWSKNKSANKDEDEL